MRHLIASRRRRRRPMGTLPRAGRRGQHSLVPEIPGIHRELPGPVPIVAIRQPARF